MKFLLLLFCFATAFSQTKGIVVDSLGTPIPYVSIFVENENKTTTSEENGTFTIQVKPQAKLIFSALGYEQKMVLATEASKVLLKQIIFGLDEVVLKKSKSTKLLEIGQVSHAILEAFDNGPNIDAKFFPYLEKYKKTKWIKKIILSTDSAIENACLKLHLYSVDENGFPGEELGNQDMIVTLKKGVYRHQFDVNAYNIEMPETGVFVAFEKMRIDRNKVEKTVTNPQTGISNVEITYAPKVLCYSLKKPFVYSYMGGKWHKKVNEEEKGEMIQLYEPSLTLLLSN